MPPRYAVFLLALICAAFSSFALLHSTPSLLRGNPVAHAIQSTSRIVRVVPASGPVGGSVSVPIEIASQGDENAIGFSLTFDAAGLGNPVVAPGGDATGATLNINTAQSAQGRIGIALAFPANQKFPAGARQLVVVTFTISANTTFGPTTINFGDQPVLREASDVNANALPLSFSSGAVTITKGFEADVSPRPDGDNNGTVTVTDWVQIGRFVAGLDTAATGNEFQRADCAPRSSLGDGKISIIDWTQAGRYATGLDPIVPAGGPTSAISQSFLDNGQWKIDGERSSDIRGIPSQTTNGDGERLMIEVDAQGVENALGFSLSFNAAHWRFISVAAARDAREAILHVNAGLAASGRIGVALALPAGRALRPGARQLLVFEFTRLAEDQTIRLATPLRASFGDIPVSREVSSVGAQVVATRYMMESVIAGIFDGRRSLLARRE